VLDAWWSDGSTPARCANCGRLAYLPHSALWPANAIILPGAFFVPFLPGSAGYWSVALAVGWLVATILLVNLRALRKIETADVEANRKYGRIFIGGLVLAAVAGWLISF
jgi:hypothetical protein